MIGATREMLPSWSSDEGGTTSDGLIKERLREGGDVEVGPH